MQLSTTKSGKDDPLEISNGAITNDQSNTGTVVPPHLNMGNNEIVPTVPGDNVLDSSTHQQDVGPRGSGSSETQTVEPAATNSNMNQNVSSNIDDYDSDAFASALESQMEEAVAAGKELRFRMMLVTTVAGAVLMVGSLVIGNLLKADVLSIDHFGPPLIYLSMVFPFGTLMLLGIIPDDIITIRIVNLCCCVVVGLYGVYECYHGITKLSKQDEISDYGGEAATYPCGADLPQLGCVLRIVKDFLNGSVCIFLAVSWSRNLRTVNGQTIYDWQKPKGFRFNDRAFQIPSREGLESLWFHGLLTCGYFAVVSIVFGSIFHAIGDRAPWFVQRELMERITVGIVSLTICLICTPARRQRVISFLTSIIAEDETKSAASVAALLGKTKAHDALALAKTKFRSINFAHLAKEDFIDNTEEPNQQNTLYDQTEATGLGGCDVFLSHSWRDDGNKKI